MRTQNHYFILGSIIASICPLLFSASLRNIIGALSMTELITNAIRVTMNIDEVPKQKWHLFLRISFHLFWSFQLYNLQNCLKL